MGDMDEVLLCLGSGGGGVEGAPKLMFDFKRGDLRKGDLAGTITVSAAVASNGHTMV